MAVLVAAAAHDAAHRGVNADYLMRRSDPLAVLYNDKSILENMHAEIYFRLLSGVESTLLAALEPAQRSQLRTWVIAMILATEVHSTRRGCAALPRRPGQPFGGARSRPSQRAATRRGGTRPKLRETRRRRGAASGEREEVLFRVLQRVNRVQPVLDAAKCAAQLLVRGHHALHLLGGLGRGHLAHNVEHVLG
ncbi:hypothetical protein T492DRAFT_957158 [Pavlovales sp. CCMP2436]|nr:hypothetical protein T492DRAFT_957158 [Pavlovales sp. CCMP2436]